MRILSKISGGRVTDTAFRSGGFNRRGDRSSDERRVDSNLPIIAGSHSTVMDQEGHVRSKTSSILLPRYTKRPAMANPPIIDIFGWNLHTPPKTTHRMARVPTRKWFRVGLY